MAEGHEVKVGDVFVESWGYDQTNVDAYQVTRISPASVWIRPIATEIVGNRRRPVQGRFGTWSRSRKTNTAGEVRKVPYRGYRGEPTLNMSSYSCAGLWDGEETYHETYAAGGMGH